MKARWDRMWLRCAMAVALVAGTACSQEPGERGTPPALDPPDRENAETSATGDEPSAGGENETIVADMLAVRVDGAPGAYTFTVTVRSPDTGCDQYADWWEVLRADGGLLYRRVLGHSHVDEQPFTRSGGPVDIEDTTQVLVRAHMNNAGYGGATFSGSVASGFALDALANEVLAPELAESTPQPVSCAF